MKKTKAHFFWLTESTIQKSILAKALLFPLWFPIGYWILCFLEMIVFQSHLNIFYCGNKEGEYLLWSKEPRVQLSINWWSIDRRDGWSVVVSAEPLMNLRLLYFTNKLSINSTHWTPILIWITILAENHKSNGHGLYGPRNLFSY